MVLQVKLLAAGLGGAVMVLAQTPAAARTISRPVVEFHCTLAGKAKGAAQLTISGVCTRFVQAIEPALKVRLVEVATAPSANKGRWIAIQVRLAAPAHAEAAFTSRLGGTVTKHQPIGIDVMDKSLDMREIDMLARQVAEVLRTAG
jgi:hypothetical protein